LEKTPTTKLIFVIDEHGRTLTKVSLHRLISELLNKVFDEKKIDVVVVNGPAINICANLLSQIAGREITAWEIIYSHGSKYPTVLLAHHIKEKLVVLLPDFKGTSAEAIYKVLMESGVFDKFHKDTLSINP